ncbi:hypothetical protein BHM03_00050879 [Ensete ventricosum]|nr:hypothetical protein BHM03_00050879 [Ensete ventricosum]
MHCGSRKQRRCYYSPMGKKELPAAAKQRRQWGSNSSGEEWQAAAHDGWQRRQVRSREEGEKQGRGGDHVGVGRWQGWPTMIKRRGGTAVSNGGRSNRGRGRRLWRQCEERPAVVAVEVALAEGDGATAEVALASDKSKGDGAAAEAAADEGGEMGQQQKCWR